jgi:hypothetical protein
MLPKEGQLKTAQRILAYLKTFPKGRIIADIKYQNHSLYTIEDHSKRKDFYSDAEEVEGIPNDLPKPGTEVSDDYLCGSKL